MQEPSLIDEFEDAIGEAKQHIALRYALVRLQNNPDYITVVAKGYLNDFALELVTRKGTNESQDSIDKDLTGIGRFINYINSIFSKANQANNDIDSAQSAINEINGGRQ
jgi:hypothetical protein